MFRKLGALLAVLCFGAAIYVLGYVRLPPGEYIPWGIALIMMGCFWLVMIK